MSNVAPVLHASETGHPTDQAPGLPNKFIYPEFAGFAGERLLKEILRCVLPAALFRTWEILTDKQAYGNDCYQGLAQTAEKARRDVRTIKRHFASLTARNLLTLCVEQKVFLNKDGSARKKAVIVKDFTGLYTLAHEYFLWCQSDEYIRPERDFADLIRQDPCLEAKLRRFDDYRRILYKWLPDPGGQVSEEDRWFQEYSVLPTNIERSSHVEDVKDKNRGQIVPKTLTKTLPKQKAEMSQERINNKDYIKKMKRDSSDSERDQERGGGGESEAWVCSQKPGPVAQDYTKRNDERGINNESPTIQPSSSKKSDDRHTNEYETCEKTERNLEARRAIEAIGLNLTEDKYSRPPANNLVHSFVHAIAGPFGDLNAKGSITGVERSIEASGLQRPAEILLCLVRAYIAALQTKEEKVRYRHPQTGGANRMPLFCALFKRFARARASGSAWDYSWQNLAHDIAEDERLILWWTEHHKLLTDEQETALAESQDRPPWNTTEANTAVKVNEAGLERSTITIPASSIAGWRSQEEAYDWMVYLLNQLASNGYAFEVGLQMGGDRYQVFLTNSGEGARHVLTSPEEVNRTVACARAGKLR